MNDWLSEEESFALLERLFPGGLQNEELLQTLCPQGWVLSPLRIAFHPGPERQYEEALAFQRNMERLFQSREKWKKKKQEEGEDEADAASAEGSPPQEPAPLEPLPSREEFMAACPTDVQNESDTEELGRLVGLCLWDILSDNHDLILPDGSEMHMGSFRATAGIVSDFYHHKPRQKAEPSDVFDFASWDMDYCEFYMGTWAVEGRTDLSPIYWLIFERLKSVGYDWKYSFPRLGVVRLPKLPPKEDPDKPEWISYDPSAALEADIEERKQEAEISKLEADLDAIHRRELEKARTLPPPKTVQAYRDVFARWPRGWPPTEA